MDVGLWFLRITLCYIVIPWVHVFKFYKWFALGFSLLMLCVSDQTSGQGSTQPYWILNCMLLSCMQLSNQHLLKYCYQIKLPSFLMTLWFFFHLLPFSITIYWYHLFCYSFDFLSCSLNLVFNLINFLITIDFNHSCDVIHQHSNDSLLEKSIWVLPLTSRMEVPTSDCHIQGTNWLAGNYDSSMLKDFPFLPIILSCGCQHHML